MPNTHAHGILFGKMDTELRNACTAYIDVQDLYADLKCKTKGFFSGIYNAIAGRIRHGGTELSKVNSKWSTLMEFMPTKVVW